MSERSNPEGRIRGEGVGKKEGEGKVFKVGGLGQKVRAKNLRKLCSSFGKKGGEGSKG